MSERKYRYLNVGDARPNGNTYEYRALGGVKWRTSVGDGNILDDEDVSMFEYRVPITEPETKDQRVCEMVLSENVQCFEKVGDKCISVKFLDGNKVYSGNMVGTKPSDFAEAPIGTIWDNVDGKPVRRTVVEKCAICKTEPYKDYSEYPITYCCDNDDCPESYVLELDLWNAHQKDTLAMLEKAGWVRK